MPAILPSNGMISRKLFSPYLLSLFILLLAGQPVMSQSVYSDGNLGLRLNEVNSHAARHFNSHFSPGSTVKWIRDDQYYVACFSSDDSRTRVHYNTNGSFAFCLKYFPADALKGELRSSIIKIFPDCQIGVVTELTDDLYKKALFVHIKDGPSLKTLRCDDEGIEITENFQDAGI